ncbi:hypothetical protein ACI65C_004046 [Semiaphis heraclei]
MRPIVVRPDDHNELTCDEKTGYQMKQQTGEIKLPCKKGWASWRFNYRSVFLTKLYIIVILKPFYGVYSSTKRNSKMVVFIAEYIPEYKWITLESNSNSNCTTSKELSNLKYKSKNNILNQCNSYNIETDFPSIYYLINLIEKMIKYNNKYYERIEKRKQKQIIELQELTIFHMTEAYAFYDN